MLFNSIEYIFLFLPIVWVLYFYLNHKRLTLASRALLVFSSLFFYSWWNIIYLPLILCSMLFNFSVANSFSKSKKVGNKPLLIVGIVVNLLLLGYFKYVDFFILNINFIFGSKFEFLRIVLPLAISFFTFQQIAYLVDSYKGQTKEYDFLSYALFVSFFPQLIAGPIVHHKEMMPQFLSKFNLVKNYKFIAIGLFIFAMGLFKKIIIADRFALSADAGFLNTQSLSSIEAWVTSLSYSFQLYFDFSGYTDMAIGSALLFNIKLPQNFNSPYKALNIQDFWRRWHMTLSRFLRDYLYIPLGGNRKTKLRVYANLITTFLLGGLWHGAGWTFVFWGLLHGFALVIHRLWQKLGIRLNVVLSWFITFNFINITWVFFRANNLEDALNLLYKMFMFIPTTTPELLQNINTKPKIFAFLFIALIVVVKFPNSNEYIKKFKPSFLYMLAFVIMFLSSVVNLDKYQVFLYFNF